MNDFQNNSPSFSKEVELANRAAKSLERIQTAAVPSGLSKYLQQQAKIMQQLTYTSRIANEVISPALEPLLQQMNQIRRLTGPVLSIPTEKYTEIFQALKTVPEFVPEIQVTAIDIGQDDENAEHQRKKVPLEWIMLAIEILGLLLSLFQEARDIVADHSRSKSQIIVVVQNGFDSAEQILEENGYILPGEDYDIVINQDDSGAK